MNDSIPSWLSIFLRSVSNDEQINPTLLPRWVWAALLLMILPLSSVFSQTHPIQILQSWGEDPHWAQTVDEPLWINRGRTDEGDRSIGIFYWDSYGRIKLDRESTQPPFTIGYRVLTIDIATDHPALPGGASDIAVVGAVPLGQVGDSWQLAMIGGLGTANDNHFSNGDAIYGIGYLHATQTLDPTRRLHIGLGYHGNRAIFPDVPIPYILYQEQMNESLALGLGLPISSVLWRPVESVTVELRYIVPVTVGAKVQWEFAEGLSLFTEYKSTNDAFYVHHTDNRRLFYELDRVAGGIRWVTKWVDLSLAVGYAFDQEFSLGWDVRDTNKITELSDEVFLSIKIAGTF